MEAQEKEFTEAELTGEESAPEPAAPEPESVVPEPVKEAEAAPGEKPAAPPTEPAKDDRTVPLAALREERARARELKARLDALEREKAEREAVPEKDPAEMILEDPEGAIRMVMQQNKALRDEMYRRELEREINREVPDFLELAPVIEEKLLDAGLPEEAIRGMIGAVGVNAPRLFKVLGEIARKVDPAAERAKIEAEITPRIVERVTKDLMAKFKIVDSGVNIGKLPGAAPTGKLNVASEAELAKLTPEQQEKWLRGEI